MANQSEIKLEDLKPCTYKMACEHIEKANFLKGEDGKQLSAIQIFNYSSTGELSMVTEWYLKAVNVLGCQAV